MAILLFDAFHRYLKYIYVDEASSNIDLYEYGTVFEARMNITNKHKIQRGT